MDFNTAQMAKALGFPRKCDLVEFSNREGVLYGKLKTHYHSCMKTVVDELVRMLGGFNISRFLENVQKEKLAREHQQRILQERAEAERRKESEARRQKEIERRVEEFRRLNDSQFSQQEPLSPKTRTQPPLEIIEVSDEDDLIDCEQVQNILKHELSINERDEKIAVLEKQLAAREAELSKLKTEHTELQSEFKIVVERFKQGAEKYKELKQHYVVLQTAYTVIDSRKRSRQ